MSEFGTKLENHISLPFLDLAFRPFFLLATLFSIFALCLWGLLLSGRLVFSPYGGGYFWHAHEMVFGFVSAVLVGFLLTAAQSWTGVRAPNGFKLFVLACVWLFARIFMLMGEIIPFEIIVSVDLSFTLLAAYFLLVMLVEKKQYRNYFAVIALLIITFLNGLTHYSLRGEPVYELRDSIHATILIITMMMTVIGGRVIPLFTANATKLPPKPRIPWLENAILLNIWVLILIYIINIYFQLDFAFLSVLFLTCALLIAIRSFRWNLWTTLRHPLLWSLQLSYWFIPLGLFFLGCHYLLDFSMSIAIHILTVGAMGGMILSMMSRVSLGHTGRALQADKIMTLSFLTIFMAAIVRVIFVLFWPEEASTFFLVTISLWSVGYSLFLFKFGLVLIRPRVDRKSSSY